MSIRVYYQVLNGGNVPASGRDNDLAIFPDEIAAERWISYLVHECGHEVEEYQTREVIVSLPLTYPGGEEL